MQIWLDSSCDYQEVVGSLFKSATSVSQNVWITSEKYIHPIIGPSTQVTFNGLNGCVLQVHWSEHLNSIEQASVLSDVDCEALVCDGNEIWINKRCAYAITSQTNVFRAWNRSSIYRDRLEHWKSRGISIAYPGLELRQKHGQTNLLQ